MAVSEKQKQYSRAWDKENMKTVSCRLRTYDAEDFLAYCTKHGTNPAAAIKTYVHSCLKTYYEELEAEENEIDEDM